MQTCLKTKLSVAFMTSFGLLVAVLALVYLFGAAQPAHAQGATQSPTTFNSRREIMRSEFLVLDLDGDGKLESITASLDGYLTVHNGISYDVIWEKNLADYLDGYSRTRVQSSLAAADIDGDGITEVVIATGGVDPIDGSGPGALIVLKLVGGSEIFQLMPGWPVFAGDALGNGSRGDGHPDGYYSTPSLGDIDGDGDMEIVIGVMDRRLHAYHHNGAHVLGWPIGAERNIWRESRSTAALADLDDDGILDILIGSNNYGIPACANPYHFYGLRGDSTLLPGFPFSTTQNIESSPAIGDINNDGSLDIIFGTGDFNENCGQRSDGKKVYALDRFGKLLPGWPVTTNANMVNSVALGDLDNDGTPEVVIHTEDTLYAWHGDGRLVRGFPVQGEYHLRHTSAVLADVDGDSDVEIVLAAGHVYGPNGELEQKRNKLQSKIVVIDQDGDGLLETIGFNHYNYNFGWHLQGYVFQESGSATGARPWPMFHRTMDRNGLLPNLFALSGRIVNEANQGVAGVKVTLDSGQIALTDGQGNYVFGSLRAGSYVVTPSFQDNVFEPASHSVDLTSNVTLRTMVMKPPVYDVAGKVMHANGSGLAGVTLELSTGATTTTDRNGRFSFDDQQPGRYTLTPVSPDLNYLPASRSFMAEDKHPQAFYALAQPVVATLQVNTTTSVELIDTQNLPTRLLFPEGLGAEEVVVTPILATNPSGYLSTGHTLAIELANTDTTADSSVIGQDGEVRAIELEIHYNTADLQQVMDAEELVLMWQSPDGWIDAASTCPSGKAVENNVNVKTVKASVCQWGTYALFAPVSRIFLPTLANED